MQLGREPQASVGNLSSGGRAEVMQERLEARMAAQPGEVGVARHPGPPVSGSARHRALEQLERTLDLT